MKFYCRNSMHVNRWAVKLHWFYNLFVDLKTFGTFTEFWFKTSSIQTFRPIICNYKSSNLVYNHLWCILIFIPLSYLLRIHKWKLFVIFLEKPAGEEGKEGEQKEVKKEVKKTIPVWASINKNAQDKLPKNVSTKIYH